MSSSTDEPTVPLWRNAIEVPTSPIPTAPSVPTTKSAVEYFREYERERPGVMALWSLGIGLALGRRLRLW